MMHLNSGQTRHVDHFCASAIRIRATLHDPGQSSRGGVIIKPRSLPVWTGVRCVLVSPHDTQHVPYHTCTWTMEGPPVCFLPYSHPHKVRAVQRETKGRRDSESEPHSSSICSGYLRCVKPSWGVSCIFPVSPLCRKPLALGCRRSQSPWEAWTLRLRVRSHR